MALPTDTLYGLAACANSQQVPCACSYLLPHCLLPAASLRCAQIKAQLSEIAGGSEVHYMQIVKALLLDDQKYGSPRRRS